MEGVTFIFPISNAKKYSLCMQRMERDAQTYGTGKLSPTPYQTLAPALATTKNGLRPKP